MGERLPFKPGDKVLVKATVRDFYRGTAGDSRWVDVEIEGRSTVFTVEADVVRPAELDVNKAFGGMPDGTVEVTRERWLELEEPQRATITMMTNSQRLVRYFEVKGR